MSTSVSIQNVNEGGLQLHSLALAAGYFGAVLGVCMIAPQLIRTLRNRALPGVSALSWALVVLSCLTWMLYGARAHEAPQIPGNILMVSGGVLIVLLVPSVMSGPARAVRLAGPASAIIVLAIFAPATVVGFVAFGIGLISALPQLARSLAASRDDRSTASGVSVPSWLLRAASQVSWLFYAVVLHDIVVTVSATFILTSSLVLVATELRRRDAAPAVPVLVRDPRPAGVAG